MLTAKYEISHTELHGVNDIGGANTCYESQLAMKANYQKQTT